MDAQSSSSSRRTLKPAQEQEVAEDWRRPKNETARRAAETSKQRSDKTKGERGPTRHAVQTISKRQALYSVKVPVNAELRPLRREKRGTAIRHFERGDEDVTE